jgi:hypothetical protein
MFLPISGDTAFGKVGTFWVQKTSNFPRGYSPIPPRMGIWPILMGIGGSLFRTPGVCIVPGKVRSPPRAVLGNSRRIARQAAADVAVLVERMRPSACARGGAGNRAGIRAGSAQNGARRGCLSGRRAWPSCWPSAAAPALPVRCRRQPARHARQ